MKEETKKKLIGGFFAFLMVASLAGFAVTFVGEPASNTLDYYDYNFRSSGNALTTKIDGNEHTFLFFPGDLEDITLPEGYKSLLDKKALVVTYNQNSTSVEALAEAQYYFETQLTENKVIQRALINNSGTSLDQADCSDATEQQPVIVIKESNTSDITLENNCMTIQAIDVYDLIRSTERVIYVSLGVME